MGGFDRKAKTVGNTEFEYSFNNKGFARRDLTFSTSKVLIRPPNSKGDEYKSMIRKMDAIDSMDGVKKISDVINNEFTFAYDD